MHSSLKVYNNSVFDFINAGFQIEILANDCLFTEGPIWNKQGYYLFSDITANCIYKISDTGVKELFLPNSGTIDFNAPDLKPDQAGSNGLAYLKEELLVCQHGSHAIAKYDGSYLHGFIESYQDKPLNSPNDIVVTGDGSIYFSDPPYGLKDGKLNPEKFQPHAGVYRWKDGVLELICEKYQYPNGVCLSNDQKVLYICSNKPFEKFISAYDTTLHQLIEIFAEENSDGIEVDRYENVYLCNKEGVIILGRNGKRLALIELPSIPANICWGGEAV